MINIKSNVTTPASKRRVAPGASSIRVPMLPTQTGHRTEDVKIVIRCISTESEFHKVADETLEVIQEKLETLIEDNIHTFLKIDHTMKEGKAFVGDDNTGGNTEDLSPEITLASGVLTIALPHRGIWVLNKQSPNKQIWWSSPISGPRRYEYDEYRKRWVYTKISSSNSHSNSDLAHSDDDTLGKALAHEMHMLFGIEFTLDV